MLRSLFFTLGLFIGLCGGSLFYIDRVVLNIDVTQQQTEGFRGLFSTIDANNKQVVNPPEWLAYAMSAGGFMTMVFSFTLSRKK